MGVIGYGCQIPVQTFRLFVFRLPRALYFRFPQCPRYAVQYQPTERKLPQTNGPIRLIRNGIDP